MVLRFSFTIRLFFGLHSRLTTQFPLLYMALIIAINFSVYVFNDVEFLPIVHHTRKNMVKLLQKASALDTWASIWNALSKFDSLSSTTVFYSYHWFRRKWRRIGIVIHSIQYYIEWQYIACIVCALRFMLKHFPLLYPFVIYGASFSNVTSSTPSHLQSIN